MRFCKPCAFLFVLAFQVIFCYASAQIADVKLDNKQSILNGRAYFYFPSEAVNSERPSDIMSAGRNASEETRIVYDAGKMRMVFFAQELYQLGDKRLFSEVSNDSAYKSNFTSKVFVNSDSLFAILSTPLKYDSTRAGIIVNSLLVQTPDSTLFRIDAYINPAAFDKLKDFTAISVKVFQSIGKGTRRNNLEERDEKYRLMDTAKSFVFHLPRNYCITMDEKYDFQVFKFHKFRKFTDSVWANMMVYIGVHPQFAYMDYGLDEGTAKKEAGTFLGIGVEWMVFTDELQRFFLKEQIIPHDEIAKGTVVHVAMLSNYAGDMHELTGIAGSVKLQK